MNRESIFYNIGMFVLAFGVIMICIICYSNFVEARTTPPSNLLDKPILNNVNGCFNLTLSYDLEDGNVTPINFIGCSNLGNSTWFCNCNVADYDLIMQTDKTMVREAREYDIDVEVNRYHIYEDSKRFSVDDWGDYTEVKGSNLDYFEDDNFDGKKCSKNVQFIYVNKTIERNITIEVPKYIQNITYVQNVSYIQNITYIQNRTMCKKSFWGKWKCEEVK